MRAAVVVVDWGGSDVEGSVDDGALVGIGVVDDDFFTAVVVEVDLIGVVVVEGELVAEAELVGVSVVEGGLIDGAVASAIEVVV